MYVCMHECVYICMSVCNVYVYMYSCVCTLYNVHTLNMEPFLTFNKQYAVWTDLVRSQGRRNLHEICYTRRGGTSMLQPVLVIAMLFPTECSSAAERSFLSPHPTTNHVLQLYIKLLINRMWVSNLRLFGNESNIRLDVTSLNVLGDLRSTILSK